MQQGQGMNNTVKLRGIVSTPLSLSHMTFGESFYRFILEVPRLSGNADLLPITISERLLSGFRPETGSVITIMGQLRSYNQYVDGASRLILTVFAKDVIYALTDEDYCNHVTLNGHICKSPIYRTTPFQREISDILLAVNRAYHKSDYVPCIAWGRNARYAHDLTMGQRIYIIGRMQSREYEKQQPDGSKIVKTAYEVSISSIETAE